MMIKASSLLIFLLGSPTFGITLMQSTNFSSGTGAWGHGQVHLGEPVVQADAGPNGPNDSALIVSSSGTDGPGSRLVVINRSAAWQGDYLSAGVSAIALDLRNLAADPNSAALGIRLGLSGPGGRILTDAVSLPAGAGWQSFSFSLSPDDFVNVNAATASSTLGNVTEIRVIHNVTGTTPAWFGSRVAGSFRADNITAIPEPSLMVLFGAGMLACSIGYRNRLL